MIVKKILFIKSFSKIPLFIYRLFKNWKKNVCYTWNYLSKFDYLTYVKFVNILKETSQNNVYDLSIYLYHFRLEINWQLKT